MTRLSPFWRVLIAVIASLVILPHLTGIDAGLTPETRWDHASVWATPPWLVAWLLGVLFPVFLASLFFVRRSPEARWAAGGFLLSHVPMAARLFETRVGTVGLIHLVCWTPALVLLTRLRPSVAPSTPFGLWVHAMIAVLAISLTFDARDAISLYVR